MYGQMAAGSWIYIGTQGILQGTYETFGAGAVGSTKRSSPRSSVASLASACYCWTTCMTMIYQRCIIRGEVERAA
jgi:hypothetical protein